MLKNLSLLIFCFWGIASAAQESEFQIDTIYNPALDNSKNVAVIYFGGSEGGLPEWEDMNFYKEDLPQMGIPTLGVAYFGSKNTSETLAKLPLEYWEEVITTFKKRPDIEGKKIVVDGISKGGELALLLGSIFNEVDAVISKAPSSVIWQGITWENVSSWTFKGEELPFVPYYSDYDYSTIENYEYLMSYTLALVQKEAVEKATIKVENINGPVILFSGEADQMWPSTLMGEMVIRRLEEHDFPFKYEHHHYKYANHSFDPSADHGTQEGNNKAFEDMHSRIIVFLEDLNSR